MGEFRRQPSKVWWLTHEDDLSRLSGFLNWGNGVDLSGTFDTLNNNFTPPKTPKNSSSNTLQPKDTPLPQNPPPSNTSRETHRDTSSSPSQGSHKSQDSGFSDSELHHNALSLSPRSSPELSETLPCVECKAREESQPNEKTYNEAVISYRRLKTSVKETSPPPDVATRSTKFLETAFDTPNKEEKNKDEVVGSPKQKNRRNLLKAHFSRTKLDTLEKINQIQNQLELSFKLPKRKNSRQNVKTGGAVDGKGSGESSWESGGERRGEEQQSMDSEGFKVPKVPGSKDVLELTDIGGPPISSSTPKSWKFRERESPLPKTARATEKKVEATTTFATIRRLKMLPERRQKGEVSRCANSRTAPDKPQPDPESSVKQWLSELETIYEAEIMTTLQSKSLATDLTRQVTNLADSTSETVRKLHQKTKIISTEFSKLCQQNKNKNEKQVKSSVQNLVRHITEFVKEYVQKKELLPRQRTDKKSQRAPTGDDEPTQPENCHEMITDFRQPEPETVEVPRDAPKTEDAVLHACDTLSSLVARDDIDRDRVEAQIADLGQKFTKVVDMLLESHIQALVRVIEEPRTELTLRTALAALTSLGLDGNQLGRLVSKCGGIRILLAVCLEARGMGVRVLALRALATVCCVCETIRQFEQAGGVEILSDILSDRNRSESELGEASAVIAQITAPWVQDNHSVDGLSQCLNSLVSSLTYIVSKYNSCETLLLASAALANLTFMEPRTVWPLLENETAKKLLMAVRRQGPKVSVFIQEQAATVIANMAAVPECRKHLVEEKAVVALLCFLEIHHSPLQRAPEVAAAERVQQKSAIAISRLCSDAVVAKQVIELQGVTRLVRLCKEEKERNHSDGVLVACLAALRKIVANCGAGALVELNAMELVEPRLLDSFLLYSSKQESYV